MKTKRWLVCIYPILVAGLSTVLMACGGGGGDTLEVVDTTAVAGYWYGTTNDTKYNITEDILGVASTNGQMRLILDSGDCAGSQYNGTFSMNGNTGSGNLTGYAISGCMFANGQPTTSGTFNFTISGDNLTGNYSTIGTSGMFTLTYFSFAEVPITISDLEGHWGYAITPGNYFKITVSSNGSFTATGYSGCDMSGQISIIDPDWAITNISVTATGCNESLLNGTYKGLGLLVFDPAGDLFYLMTSKSNLSYFDVVGRLP